MKRSSILIMAATMFLVAGAGAQDFRYNKAGDLTNVQSSVSSAVPAIITQPLSGVIAPGLAYSLSVVAVGPGTLNYQWYKDGALLGGKTNFTLLFTSFSSSDAGSYYATVSNANGQTQSTTCILSVPPNPFANAAGNVAVDWYFAGTYPWRVVTNAANTHDGVSSVGVENTKESQGFFEGLVTVSNMTTLRFWAWSISTWDGASYFAFRINDHSKEVTGHQSGWQQFEFHLPPGTHKLTFEHSGAGSLYIDDITLTPALDSDSDGMSDDYETQFFGNLSSTAAGDLDSDRNSNLIEYLDITDPGNSGSLFRRLYQHIEGPGQLLVSLSEPQHGYEYDTSLTCTPVPQSNSVFVGWSGAVSNHFPSATLIIPYYSSLVLTAHFSPLISLGEALDAPSLSWTTGGTAPFISQTNFTSDGVDAIRVASHSPMDGTNQTWLETSITGPVTLKFDARMFSGPHYSFPQFHLLVNGIQYGGVNGWGGWMENVVFLPPGTHTVRWLFEQDATTSTSWNIPALDRVRITPALDTDSDGLSDEWEMYYFYNLARDGTGDRDGDRVSDLTEYLELTQPYNEYSLRVRLYPSVTGSGTILVQPTKATYDPGEEVILTAVPSNGWALESWSGMTNVDQGTRQAAGPVFTFYPNLPTDITANFVPETNLGEAIDYTNFIWQSTFPRWLVTTNTTHDGIDAVQTPPVLPHTIYESAMSASIEGPKILSFWWKAEVRPGTTHFRFETSGVAITNSGNADWERLFLQLPAGSNLVSWTYYNNAWSGTGSTGWVDDVHLAVDTDEDGLSDEWEQQNFGSLAQTANGDPDGDQVNNQNEWADGTDPTDSSSATHQLVVLRDHPDSVHISPYLLDYAPGTEVTLTADQGAFIGWSGDATGTNNPLVITMDSSKRIAANFNEVALALDNTHLNFVTGGDAPWTRKTEIQQYAIGDDVAASGAGLTNGQTSWVELTLRGPGKLSFNIWPQMNYNDGHLRWELDNVELDRIAQFYYTPWRISVNLLPGTHTFRWVFEQGISASEGAWLDDVDWEAYENVPLATALDNANSWTTSSNAPWLGQTEVTHDGVDAAGSGGIANNEQTYLQTTINNEHATLVTFWWKVSSEWGADKLEFLVDGAPLPDVPFIAGDVAWAKVAVQIPAGPHTLRWVYSKDQSYSSGEDKGWVDEITFQEVIVYPLATALDTTGLTWTTGGSGGWVGNNLVTHDGVDAASSGNLSDSQTNWMRTTITGPGTLSYWWKVSSENGWDTLRLYMDGSPNWDVLPISGEVDWTQVTVSIPGGSHNIAWYYTKDSFGSSGEDMAWVDQVTFTPTNIVTVPTFLLTMAASPSNGGWVYANPHSGNNRYDSNTLVTVTAYPATGKAFAGWTGASKSKTNTITIRMNSNKTLTAIFTNLPPSYPLNTTVSPTNGGSVLLNPGGGLYLSNTTVRVTAVANAGFRFLRWTGAASGTSTVAKVLMNRARTVNAIFTNLPSYTLTANMNPSNAGTINALPFSPDNRYFGGSIVSVSAEEEGTNVFSAWIGAVNSLTNPISVMMNTNKTVTALFNNPGTYIMQRTNGQLAVWFMQSTQRVASVLMNNGLKVGAAWKFGGAADFNVDSHKDFVFTASGKTVIWQMDRNFVTNKVTVRSGFTMPSAWRLVGAGDFTLDGQPDLLWQNTNGTMQVWTMNGMAYSSHSNLTNKANAGWKALAVADFNNDQSADIVFQNSKKQIALWLMNGKQRISPTFVNSGFLPPAKWVFRGVGDLDGDGQLDLIFQKPDGALMAWLMDGPTFKAALGLPATAAPGWILKVVK